LRETQRDTAILIEPLLAETELLLNEAERLRERQRLGEIRMPMNGTIIRRHQPTGEAVRAHEPLFTILEESSLEIELFLTQSTANRFQVGDTLNVHLAPYQESVTCTVVAIGQELRAPPEQIQAWYVPKSQMVPFRLRPNDS
ncbi:MAG: HlyD family efflux transporter periplasmic adaptor subunit, partial [Phycisphaerae bacterium]